MSPELDSISTPEAPESAFGGTTQAVLMGATAGSLTELPPAPALPQSPFNPKGEVAAAEAAEANEPSTTLDATPTAATAALSPLQKGALTPIRNTSLSALPPLTCGASSTRVSVPAAKRSSLIWPPSWVSAQYE